MPLIVDGLGAAFGNYKNLKDECLSGKKIQPKIFYN